MSGQAAPAAAEGEQHDSHGHHHSPFLQHHFESHEQQRESGKLGIWLFLAQEILFFSGLFCAYAVYRSNHPEVFQYASQFLDVKMGAINTGVLIFSSFTMAWAVRNAQLGQNKLLMTNLAITFLCACGFLGIKYVEYSHKFHDGLLWGKNYQHQSAMAPAPGEAALTAVVPGRGPTAPVVSDDSGAAFRMPDAETPEAPATKIEPRNVHIFFGIYFGMTGLHAIHVLAGMAVIAWMFIRAAKGHFTPEYYGPVDFVGLYWHLVDLVWIYLFPLLYLIG